VTVEERVQSEHELLDGWRFVDHVEVVEDDDPGDPEIGLEPWAKGDEWRYTTLEVDAHMDGPSDRWEADRHFRDLAERVTGRRPGPESNWSLRSSPADIAGDDRTRLPTAESTRRRAPVDRPAGKHE